MPRDERPMVGAIPGLDGFYVVVSHSGSRSARSGAASPPPSSSTAASTPTNRLLTKRF